MTGPSESAPVEVELKFLLNPEAVLALRRHPAFARGRIKTLTSTYFDTTSQALREAGLSLRVRESGGRFVQTVKSVSGTALFDRAEWETPTAACRPDRSALEATPVGEVLRGLRGARLVAMFSTAIERTTFDICADSAAVEVALDEGEIVAGRRRSPIRELELELKTGDPAALFRVAKDLSVEAALRLSFESKSERGYRLATGGDAKALKADRGGLTSDLTAADAFRRIVRACLGQVTANADRLIESRSGDALHQTRVGLRRLRAAFSVFRPMLAGQDFDRLTAETRWLAQALNAARDLDVFIRSLVPTPDDHPENDAADAMFRARLLTRQAAAYDDAIGVLRSSRYTDLMLDIAAWTEAGEWSRTDDRAVVRGREERVVAVAQRSLEHLRGRVRKRGRTLASLDAERRHSLRIKVKKLRYAAEFFAGMFAEHPRRTRLFGERLRALQDRLGELNDIAVARRIALACVDQGSGEVGFAAGLVVGRREAQIPALLNEAAGAFRAFTRAGAFW